jgi:hypothetical protein
MALSLIWRTLSRVRLNRSPMSSRLSGWSTNSKEKAEYFLLALGQRLQRPVDLKLQRLAVVQVGIRFFCIGVFQYIQQGAFFAFRQWSVHADVAGIDAQ